LYATVHGDHQPETAQQIDRVDGVIAAQDGGADRIVRRMLDAVDHPVTDLVRTRVGPISLGQQRPGKLRAITGPELGSLYTAVGM